MQRGDTSPGLGCVNPALYAMASARPSAFRDVVIGSNNCTATQHGAHVCCPYGFAATQGWDPATGWGTVDHAEMMEYFLSLGKGEERDML